MPPAGSVVDAPRRVFSTARPKQHRSAATWCASSSVMAPVNPPFQKDQDWSKFLKGASKSKIQHRRRSKQAGCLNDQLLRVSRRGNTKPLTHIHFTDDEDIDDADTDDEDSKMDDSVGNCNDEDFEFKSTTTTPTEPHKIDPSMLPEASTHTNFTKSEPSESAFIVMPTKPRATGRPEAVRFLFAGDPPGFKEYDASRVNSPIDFQFVKSAALLPDFDLKACMDIVEQTSGADYRTSSIGWNPLVKREEMADHDMMYLLVRQPGTSGKILGFMSFMFTFDDPPFQDREVVYMYEIHLLDTLRGRGLGSKLMTFLEAAARRCFVHKTMLTVFATNKRARKMYEDLGYVKDRCSPRDRKTRHRVIEADYIIMSKELDFDHPTFDLPHDVEGS